MFHTTVLLAVNRAAEKAVDDLFEGVTIGSSGSIRATKSNGSLLSNSHHSSSTSSSTSSSASSTGSGGTDSGTSSSGSVVGVGGGSSFKKTRALFADDSGFFSSLESGSSGGNSRFEPSTAPSAATALCPTPVKIKKEDDGVLSPRSQLHHHNGGHLQMMANGTGGGVTSLVQQQQQQQQQPIARKRTAYQAALLINGGQAGTTTTTGPGNPNNHIGLLSESSPEVSSSQNCISSGISPVPSLESSEIDLELWDLDIHESSTSQSSGTTEF
ncbi:Oxysterols receptor LXR-alpha [Tyrophagus putrescentiae]|nr:Oxysterols receptor LXR-alpha [Tyrophagus putrescentiae]